MNIIQTTFMGRGKIRPEWRKKQDELIRHRIKIFKQYTLKSLLNQTDIDFLHWICFRPKDRSNKDIQALRRTLKKIGYNFVFTFNKQPYWDDRGKNDDLTRRISQDLALLRHFVKENVYLTVLDSDDCFRRQMVETIKKQKFVKKGALVVKKGCCLMNGKVYEWKPKSNPPFYTIMFTKDEFTDPIKYILRWGEKFKSHEDVPKINKTKKLPDGMYLVIMHKTNRSTKNPKGGRHPYIGKTLKLNKNKEFGV